MKKAYLKYLAALLLFGLNGIVASQIHLSSYEIVLLRTLIGSLLLLIVFLATGGRLTAWKQKRQFLYLAVSGAAMGASWMFLYEAYQQIGVSIATLAYYCGPVIVMALSPVLFREKLRLPKILGFLAVLFGAALVNVPAAQEEASLWGLVCGGLSAVTYAAMVIFNKKARDITGMENALLQLLAGLMTVAAFVGVKEGFSISVAAADWPYLAILGLVNTGAGCYFYFSSIGRLPVQTVAVCGYLEPLSAVVFSVLFLQELLRPGQIIGAACILIGAIAAECLGNSRKPS